VRCEVTGDMRYCKVFFSVLGSEEVRKNAKKGMEAAAGWLRRELSAGLGLRYTPELVMVLDDSISHGAHISQILRGLEETKDEGEEDGANRQSDH